MGIYGWHDLYFLLEIIFKAKNISFNTWQGMVRCYERPDTTAGMAGLYKNSILAKTTSRVIVVGQLGTDKE